MTLIKATPGPSSNGAMPPDRLDSPIARASQDRLGFAPIANALAEAVMAESTQGGLVIGVDGEWGSGKSSLLNLLHQVLQRGPITLDHRGQSIHSPARWKRPPVVRFEPWLVGTRAALIAQLFQHLVEAVEDIARQEASQSERAVEILTKDLESRLRRLGRLAQIASSAATVFDPSGASWLVAVLRFLGEQLSRLKSGPGSLEKQRDSIRKRLQSLAATRPDLRFVIIVDDLDRLDPVEALEILRLVKAVADFPYVTYVLAYDKEILAKSVKRAAKVNDGEAYLEKIIQFSIKVPPPAPFELRNWLKADIQRQFPRAADYNSHRANIVLGDWAGRLIRTPRDVNRILNAVTTMWASLHDNGDLLDLIWLEIVKEKAASGNRSLYGWLRKYLQSLDAIVVGGRVTGTVRDQDELVSILTALGWQTYSHGTAGSREYDPHNLNELLAGISESIIREGGTHSNEAWIFKFDREEFNEFREAKRLSSPWHWRYYFAFAPPSHALSDAAYFALREAAGSYQDLADGVIRLIDLAPAAQTNLSDQLLERVAFDTRRGNLANAAQWLRALVDVGDDLEKRSHDFGLGKKRAGPILEDVAREVIKKTDPVNRDLLLGNLFREGKSVWALAEIYRGEYGRHARKSFEDQERMYLAEIEVERAGNVLAGRLSKLTVSEFQSLRNPWEVLFAWRDAAGSTDVPGTYLTTATKSDQDLTKTLDSLLTISASGVYFLNVNWLRILIDPAPLRCRLEALRDSRDADLRESAIELLSKWIDEPSRYGQAPSPKDDSEKT